jgi:hypothetical protein
MPVPMFFVEKKGGDLRPVQDCRALNNITVKNALPIPLIPELIDRLHGTCYFTKFDICVGYNNIRIKEGDEYKAAFKTLLGLFECYVTAGTFTRRGLSRLPYDKTQVQGI